MEWKTVKLGDVGTIVGGATPLTKNAAYYDGDIAWITPKDLANHSHRYISRGERNITEDGFRSCSCKMMPKGSILFSSRAPIGYIAIAENDLCTNQGFKSIIPDADKIDNIFLFYLLNYHKDYIAGLGSGTTFMEVSGSVMKNIEVKIPSLKTQHLIAAILSSLDDKIENNNRINRNLEAQAQALFKSWFVDFEPWGGKMPDDWREGVLSDIADITMGQSPRGESYNTQGEGVIFYQGCSDFGDRFPSVRMFTTEPARYAVPNSILMSVRAPVGTMNVALEECCIGRGLASLKEKNSYDSFLLYLLESLQNVFDSYNGDGTVFGSINKKSIGNIKIVIPSIKVVESFHKMVSPLDEKIKFNHQESQCLATLRDTLLPKLMKGEIEV